MDAGRDRHPGARRPGWVAPIVVAALLLCWPVLVFIVTTRHRPHRNPCASNLKQIGYACHLYAGNHDGEYPTALADLHPRRIPESSVMVCYRVENRLRPREAASAGRRRRVGGTRRARESAAAVPLRSEDLTYCYVTGLRSDDMPDYVLAFDEEWNHEGEGVTVLYIGSNVSWQLVERLRAQLDWQRTRLTAEGREMKIIRPSWSRWPERPEYPVTFWYESRLAHALFAAGALAAVVMPALFILRRRRRARGTGSGT